MPVVRAAGYSIQRMTGEAARGDYLAPMYQPDPSPETKKAIEDLVGQSIDAVEWDGYSGIVIVCGERRFAFMPTRDEVVEIYES